jgi:hypothetical protein
MYPTTTLRTANDDYKVVTFKWTASSKAYVFVNGVQENSANMTTAFTYTNVGRMCLAMNASLNIENAYVRIASFLMYSRELSGSEVADNYNATESTNQDNIKWIGIVSGCRQ